MNTPSMPESKNHKKTIRNRLKFIAPEKIWRQNSGSTLNQQGIPPLSSVTRFSHAIHHSTIQTFDSGDIYRILINDSIAF